MENNFTLYEKIFTPYLKYRKCFVAYYPSTENFGFIERYPVRNIFLAQFESCERGIRYQRKVVVSVSAANKFTFQTL